MKKDRAVQIPKDVVNTLQTLEDRGFAAWLVGGCVRDAWLGVTPKDYDIASDATPDEVEDVFKSQISVRIGRAFGTVGVHTGQRLVEITTFREESGYTDGRHPDRVSYAKEIHADLARRDFTMNAMAWHPRHGLLDPYKGRQDLRERILRAVGDARRRLEEDALRILRAVRFAHRFELELERSLLEACRESAPSLQRISQERITAEVESMLLRASPSEAFRRMEETGLFPVLFPFLESMRGWEQGTPYHHLTLYEHTLCAVDRVPADLALRWAALLHDVGKLTTRSVGDDGIAHYYGHDRESEAFARAFCKKWRLPSNRAEEICLLVRRHMANVNPYTKKSLKRLLRYMEVPQLEKLFVLQEADCECASNQGTAHIREGRRLLREILTEKEPFRRGHLAVRGSDLLALGIPEGKEIGDWLEWALRQVEDGNAPNEKKTLLARIQAQRGRNGMGKYFGTDGIRGIANQDLTPTLAYRVGLATAEVLAKNSKGRGVLIGKDTRKSGDMLEAALISGLTAGGLDVVTAGVLPTPGVAYLTRARLHAAGIVISASHNPGEYNGIKLFGHDGYKLPDAVEEEIEAHIDGPLPAPLIGMQIGSVRPLPEAASLYAEFLRERIQESLLGVKVALDCGHGAVSDIAPELFEALGATVVVMNREPDGMNINKQCGSTNPEIIRRLIQKTGSDLGFAFDGDGDRVIAVDETGVVMDGDHILAALGRSMHREGTLKDNGIVGTVMTNIGLDRFCRENGLTLYKAAVGDRYVLEKMREHGYVLGGEQSGHIIFLDHNTTGDGMLTALKLAELVVREKQPLSALNQLMHSYPQVLVNARVRADQKHAYAKDTQIQEAIAALEDSYHGEGRVLIRPSGTEPLVRVMIEGEDQERLNADAQELARKIEERYGV